MILSGLSNLAVQWKIELNPDSSREVVEVCLKKHKEDNYHHFLSFSIVSLQNKWNGTRLLQPGTESIEGLGSW